MKNENTEDASVFFPTRKERKRQFKAFRDRDCLSFQRIGDFRNLECSKSVQGKEKREFIGK